ncbi:carbohydrate-binding module family 50 protein [Ramaria rubella]|nr:carbohydrate-binding module family 50 protein [Ramaria rubella]
MTFATTLFTLVVLATSAVALTFPANCARNYTVKAGDTCDSISAVQNVSTFQLANVNEGTIDPACDDLFPTEVICLGIIGQDCTNTTVVTDDETCVDIADKANITTSLLLENNPNVNPICTNIFPGEVLCTANTDIVHLPPS